MSRNIASAESLRVSFRRFRSRRVLTTAGPQCVLRTRGEADRKGLCGPTAVNLNLESDHTVYICLDTAKPLISALLYGARPAASRSLIVCRRIRQILHVNLQVPDRRDFGREARRVDAGLVCREQAQRLHVRAHHLDGGRQWNRRNWRQLVRAPEARSGWAPSGLASPHESVEPP